MSRSIAVREIDGRTRLGLAHPECVQASSPIPVESTVDPRDGDRRLVRADLLAQLAVRYGAALRERFGLTAREASIAAGLIGGLRLCEITEGLGIEVSTARTHLKRVFSKTGVSRQVELVRLALVGPDASWPS